MKKHFKTAVLAAALMASTTMVFASDIANIFTGKNLVDYSWQKYESDGVTPDGAPLVNQSPNNPFPTQCTNGSDRICVVGTPDEGEPIVFYYPN